MAPISSSISSAKTPRTDLSTDVTSQRPTPKANASFQDVMSQAAASNTLQSAQSMVSQLPGGPVLAAALRGATGGAGVSAGVSAPSLGGHAGSAALPSTPVSASVGSSSPLPIATTSSALTASAPATNNPLAMPAPEPTASVAAEGPGASSGAAGGSTMQTALQASSDQNLYYLQLQEAMATENRVYTAQSNVLKARHDTVKNAIGNIR